MSRLTHKRNNGIKEGYWSPNKKEELVQTTGGIRRYRFGSGAGAGTERTGYGEETN